MKTLAMITALLILSSMLLAEDSKPRSKRVLFFHSHSCQPCKLAMREIDPWMRASNWTLGPSPDCHVQYVDIDTAEGQLYVSRFNVETLPSFVLVRDSKELARKAGYATSQPESVRRTVIVDLWNEK